MNNMKWANLKEMKCPKCSSSSLTDSGMGYKCGNCDFYISYERFREVINNMYSRGRHYDPDAVDRSDWS